MYNYNFFKSLGYLYEVVRTTFIADFWTFRNFDRNFSKIVAPPNDGNENYASERAIPSQKTM